MIDRKALPFAAASRLGSGAARQPVTLDVPVRIKAEAHHAQPAFIEDTRTALVFSRGAVVPVGEPLDVGQSVLLTHRRTRQEIPCRVVYAKNQPSGGVKGYVELEFLRPAPNFWQIQFPNDDAAPVAAEATRHGAAVVNVPSTRAAAGASPAAMASAVPAPPIQEGPENVVALTDPVMPSRARPAGYGSDVVVSTPSLHRPYVPPAASAVIDNAPLVEDIETLLDRKAAATAAAEPVEPVSFSLPLHENSGYAGAPAQRKLAAFGIGAKIAAVAAALAIVSLGAWQIVAGTEAESLAEAQIGLADAPALQPPAAPDLSAQPAQAALAPSVETVTSAAASFVTERGAATVAPTAAPVAATPTPPASSPAVSPAPAPQRVVEQGHEAPVPFARARQEEAARAAEELAARTNTVEPRPLVRVMTPAEPRRSVLPAADPAAAPPSIAASFDAAPLGSIAPKSAPPPIQGGRAVPPKLVSTARLMYPVLAKKSSLQGDVVIDALVDKQGRVSDMKVTSGHAMLHQAALDSVAQWRYEPGMLNGQPVDVRTTIIVKFRLASGQ